MEPAEQGLRGRRVGAYEIRALIGSGGMGEVYEGYDGTRDRPVAIKAIRQDRTIDPQARRRFRDEVRRSSRLVHPYIATVFDVVDCDEMPLLVMELIDGRTLDRYLSEAGPDRPDRLRLAVEIAEGLAAIHESDLVHRDLKPGNVMVTRQGHVKITDFGLATRSAVSSPSGSGETETAPDRLIGTVAYMAPEQVRGERVDHRSDLFSLGIVLSELLLGRHPFARGTAADTMSAILNEEPWAAGASPTDAAAPLIASLLAKRREARPRDAGLVVRALRDLERGGTPALPAQRVLSWRWPALALALVALAAGIVWISGEGTARRPPIAVLPFEVVGDAGDSAGRGAMMASVLTAHLVGARAARPVTADRVAEVWAHLPVEGDLRERLAETGTRLSASWLLRGRLLREGERYTVSLELYDSHDLDRPQLATLGGEGLAALGRLAAARVLELVGDEPELALDEGSGLAPIAEGAQLDYEQARAAAARMDYAQALPLLRRATEREPDFLRALALEAELLDRTGFERDARQTVVDAVARMERRGLPRGSRIDLELRALHDLLHNQAGEAASRLATLAAAAPDDPAVIERWVRALQRAGRHAEALERARALQDLDPKNPRALLLEAHSLSLTREPAEAHLRLDRAEAEFAGQGIVTGLGETFEKRGFVFYNEADYPAAAKAYARAAELYRDAGLRARTAGPIKSQGDVAVQLWQLDTASRLLDEALTITRESGDYDMEIRILNSLGAARWRQHRHADAERAYLEALDEATKIHSEDRQAPPLSNLANLLIQQNRTGEARGHARRALELARRLGDRANEVSARLRLADADRQDGALEQAVESLRALSQETPDPGPQQRLSVWLQLTDALEDSADLPAAGAAADRAVEVAREVGPKARLGYTLALRSRIHAAAGQLDEARRDLAEAEPLLTGESRGLKLDLVLRLARATIAAAEQRWADVLAATGSSPEWIEEELPALWSLRARALAATGRRKEAVALAVEASGRPWLSEVNRRLLARLLAELGSA